MHRWTFRVGPSLPLIAFKHSVINRSNGDDITVWVHQSFQEERDIDPAGDLAERQVKTLDWYGDSSTSYRRCHSVRYGDKTTSTSPTADKTEALATWARKTSGSWLLSALPFKGPKWLDVAVAGSDSGENIKLSMHFMTMEGSQLATSDVLDIATHVQTNFKRKFGNVWRAEADGGHMCSVAIYISFTGRPVSHWAHWRLLGTADRV